MSAGRSDVRLHRTDRYLYFFSTEPQTQEPLRMRRAIEIFNRGTEDEQRRLTGSWEHVPEGEMPALTQEAS